MDNAFLKTAFAPFIDSLGNVIPTPGTNKSGWLLTLFLNTFVIIISLIAMWIEAVGDSLDSITSFFENVKFRVIGDDNLFTVSDKARVFFNADNYQEFMRGIIPFEAAYPEARPVEQMSFVSKRTVFDEVYQKYVPTWAYSRVYSTALYDKVKRGGGAQYDRFMKLLQLRILSFYDKQAYEQLDNYCVDILQSLYKRFGHTRDYKTLYDLYWTPNEIREFFCVPNPRKQLRLYVTDEFFTFSDEREDNEAAGSAHLSENKPHIKPAKVSSTTVSPAVRVQFVGEVLDEEEDEYGDVVLHVQTESGVVTTMPTFELMFISAWETHQQTLPISLRKPSIEVSPTFSRWIYLSDSGTLTRNYYEDQGCVFVCDSSISPYDPDYDGVLWGSPKHVYRDWLCDHKPQTFLNPVVPKSDNKEEDVSQGRKSVTVVFPLQASLFQTGLQSPILSRSSTNRACMSTKVVLKQRSQAASRNAARVIETIQLKGNKAVKPRPPRRPKAASRAVQAVSLKRAAGRAGPAVSVQQLKQAVAHTAKEVASDRAFNKACATVAKSVLNPISADAFRNPQFSNRPTAVSKLHDEGTLDFPYEGVADQLVNEQNSFVAIYPDPRCVKRRLRRYSTATYYQWWFADSNSELQNHVGADTPANQFIPPLLATLVVGGASIHGDYQIPGQSKDYNGMFIAPSAPGTTAILFQNLPISATVNVLLYKNVNKVWSVQNIPVSTNVAGGGQITIVEQGHYAVGFENQSDLSSGNVLVYTNYFPDGAQGLTIGQEVAAEFMDFKIPIETACVTARSLLCSNISKILDKNGSVYMVQCPQTTQLDYFVPNDPDNKMSTVIGRQQLMKYMVADKGCHAPWVPASAQDYQNVDCSGCEDSEDPVPAYDIDATGDYVLVVFEIPEADGRAFHFFDCYHLQWKTNSLMFELGVPFASVEEMNAVLKKVGTMGPDSQFAANENHIQKIGAWLKKRFLPNAANLAEAAAPMFGPYGSAIMAAGKIARAFAA